MIRKLAYLLIAVLVIGGGVYLWKRSSAAPAREYVTTPAKRGRIEAKVTATGTVSPLVNVLVGSQISGRVSALYADYNTPVKKGQVIARLDTAMFEATAEQARANVLAADGNLAKAKAQAIDAKRQSRRSAELATQKLVAQADADTADANNLAAEAGVKAAEGQLALAKASLTQAQINLKYATIYSPINGVVTVRSVDVGQTVAAAMTAPTLFQIAEDLKKMQVDTSVAESDVGKLKDGMEAVFTVDAYPSDRFRGKVRQIRNAPTTVQNVVTYDAVVDVENPDLKLKPGMTANVTFVYAEAKDALKIPASALRFQMPDEPQKAGKKDGNKKEGRRAGKLAATDPRTVWILPSPGATPVAASIHVGISDGSFVEVLDGPVKEGDAIVTEQVGDDARPSSPGGGGGGRGPRGM